MLSLNMRELYAFRLLFDDIFEHHQAHDRHDALRLQNVGHSPVLALAELLLLLQEILVILNTEPV